MEKSYLNKVDEIFMKERDRCVHLMKEIINEYPRFDYNFIPWCPMAYGPRIGYLDNKTGDTIHVIPQCIIYNIDNEYGQIDINSTLSIEDIMNLVKENVNI